MLVASVGETGRFPEEGTWHGEHRIGQETCCIREQGIAIFMCNLCFILTFMPTLVFSFHCLSLMYRIPLLFTLGITNNELALGWYIYILYWPNVRSRWLDIDQVLKTQERMKPMSNHVDRKGLVNRGLILWPIVGHTRDTPSGQDGSMP